MAKIGVSLKINTSVIDMARLFAGQKGNYLDATIFIELDELDQYGNSGMITQDVSKEEKAQGVKGNILGNGKVFWVENGQAPQQGGQAPVQSFQQAPIQAAPMAQPQQMAQPMQQTPMQQQAPQQQMAPPQGQPMGVSQQQPVQQPAQNGFAPQTQFDQDIPFNQPR